MAVSIDRLVTDLQALYVPPFGAVATFRKIRQVLGEFEREAGARVVKDLTATAVARWIGAFPDRTPATAYTLLSSFRRACSYAVLQGWLKSTPFDFRPLTKWVPDRGQGERKRRHHPIVDLEAVLGRLAEEARWSWEGHRLFALTMATFQTGARALEVQASRVEDYDLVGRLFSIRPNERRRLKTRQSRRSVVMPEELTGVMAAWLPYAGSEWAFPGVRRVSPWMAGSAGRKPLDCLKAAGERSGVVGLTFLSLRHSYVTHSQGLWRVPPLLTQQFCGHTRESTTEGYRGFDLDNAREAVQAIALGIAGPRAVLAPVTSADVA